MKNWANLTPEKCAFTRLRTSINAWPFSTRRWRTEFYIFQSTIKPFLHFVNELYWIYFVCVCCSWFIIFLATLYYNTLFVFRIAILRIEMHKVSQTLKQSTFSTFYHRQCQRIVVTCCCIEMHFRETKVWIRSTRWKVATFHSLELNEKRVESFSMARVTFSMQSQVEDWNALPD